jgi:hypothetical protein
VRLAALPVSLALVLANCENGASSVRTADAAPPPIVLTPAEAPQISARPGPLFGNATGLICVAAILEAMSEMGRRCVAGEDSRFRSELEETTARIDDHLRQRGGWTDAQLAAFKAQMGEHDASTEEWCGNEDARRMYDGFASLEPGELRRGADVALARPDPPEWGSCL